MGPVIISSVTVVEMVSMNRSALKNILLGLGEGQSMDQLNHVVHCAVSKIPLRK